MAATLIKLVKPSGGFWEFSPSKIVLISYEPGESSFGITLDFNNNLTMDLPSPADALVKIGELESAIDSGTGIVIIDSSPTATTTTTTTEEPTTTTTEEPTTTTTEDPESTTTTTREETTTTTTEDPTTTTTTI